MSRLAEFRAAEKALQEQLAQLESLKNDAGLKKEIEFEEKLKKLMDSYGKSLRDVIAILDPTPRKAGAAVAAERACAGAGDGGGTRGSRSRPSRGARQ